MCALLWVLSLLLSILEHNCVAFSLDIINVILNFFPTVWLTFLFVVFSGSRLALWVRILCGSPKIQLTRLFVTIRLTVLILLLDVLPPGILDSDEP
ncbi:Mas-related G-protein coupled receptor member A6 [Sciurus carolinensis]|uniref:Mas-related G-protein coupled receptor member A6 n=1 Tax=Sciurus carolinensis TaxID=30640 RepID=A0AA41SQI6_SCICA|nr:Mas-related G-protein coupled receptor member A6 [Sciurus carolinensis]